MLEKWKALQCIKKKSLHPSWVLSFNWVFSSVCCFSRAFTWVIWINCMVRVRVSGLYIFCTDYINKFLLLTFAFVVLAVAGWVRLSLSLHCSVSLLHAGWWNSMCHRWHQNARDFSHWAEMNWALITSGIWSLIPCFAFIYGVVFCGGPDGVPALTHTHTQCSALWRIEKMESWWRLYTALLCMKALRVKTPVIALIKPRIGLSST